MKRRKVVSAFAGVGLVGLGGCASDEDDNRESNDDDAGNGDDNDVDDGNGDSSNEADNGEPEENTDESPADEGPESIVIEYYEAWDDGDIEAADELIHEDSTDFYPMSEDQAEWGKESTLIVEETEIVDQSDETALVRVVVTGFPPDESGSETDELRFRLQKENGDWKLYE